MHLVTTALLKCNILGGPELSVSFVNVAPILQPASFPHNADESAHFVFDVARELDQLLLTSLLADFRRTVVFEYSCH